MKSSLKAILIGLTLIFSPVGVGAADPAVIVSHKITNSVSGSSFMDLTVMVRITNPGAGQLTNVSLSFVPLPPLVSGSGTLNIGTLGPQQSVNLSLQLTVPPFMTADKVAHGPLFWSGIAVNAQGVKLEFPATSHPGGVL